MKIRPFSQRPTHLLYQLNKFEQVEGGASQVNKFEHVHVWYGHMETPPPQ